MVIAWFDFLVNISIFPNEPEGVKPVVVAYLLPVCYIFLALSSLFLGLVLLRWRGDAKTRLLLRIADELQRRED